jgi:hypothetical protein
MRSEKESVSLTNRFRLRLDPFLRSASLVVASAGPLSAGILPVPAGPYTRRFNPIERNTNSISVTSQIGKILSLPGLRTFMFCV